MSIRHASTFFGVFVLGVGTFLSLSSFAGGLPVWIESETEAVNEPLDSALEVPQIMPTESQPQFFNIDAITPEIIINLGKAIWPIIEAGRPVVDIRTDWANAVPQGVNTWENLAEWRTPISKSFSFKWKNLGVRVIHFDYSVIFTPGGRLNGNGRYLANVSVIPAKVSVSWGYKFSAQAQVSGITNAGSSSDPIAALQLVLTWTIDTPLTHHQLASDFYMTGSGDFRQVTAQ